MRTVPPPNIMNILQRVPHRMKKTTNAAVHRMIALGAVLATVGLSTSIAGDIVGRIKPGGIRDVGNAVVYIASVGQKRFKPPETHALMDQKDLTFIPRVLPVLVGTTVDYLNSDDVLHNVFTEDSCTGRFDLGTWPKGEVRSYRFDTPGCKSVMLCNVHPEMGAYVLVLENPYFAACGEHGEYAIRGVPPGEYTLKVWHERLAGESRKVVVPASGSVNADILIKK